MAMGSVVHVKYTHKIKKDIKDHMTSLIPENAELAVRQEWRRLVAAEMRMECDYTTGFVVGEDKNFRFILTCAHSFERCFDENHPISVKTVEKLYEISVTCDHLELQHRLNGHAVRAYTPALVKGVNSKKDLLLLQVLKGFCSENHPPLEVAQNLPDPLKTVVMVSWPCLRHRTACKGEISHQGREYSEISDSNFHGYNFTGLEVNITAEHGSSGAPLLDLMSKVIGLLHGGRIECFTYFVSLADIRAELTNWGLIKEDGSRAAGGGRRSNSRRKRQIIDWPCVN